MSQLIADINVPTPEEDPEDIPPHSLATVAALQPVKLDWNEEVEREAPPAPVLEEEVMEVGHFQDPCLPSPPREPIPEDLGCSRQRFKQESNQSKPSDLREECVREMECRACHLDTSNAISGQGSSSQETSHHWLGVCGQRMLRDWFTPKRNSVWPEAKVN